MLTVNKIMTSFIEDSPDIKLGNDLSSFLIPHKWHNRPPPPPPPTPAPSPPPPPPPPSPFPPGG